MKTRIDEQFRREVERFRFQFTCTHCAHYCPVRDECAEGYPSDEHRDEALVGSELLFCKLFEGA